ncbi:Similar to Alkali-sensitive linkage protein 1; acc. no. Q09788 [Pyronema omphalodes CBS 100304]|uniref:Similar to Alkali-sensitive linkage protein 1 acc. no. Q09788 n=1 Tax=Pyronema omphalodes (strain CBS 100304) TaxID=1076935 RepID=U4L668_PYROM|nr:Similar to Alkali-sensitive linkage protein 1; acc. no. Q09788 [Pyronema omphalodes CBS 100304]
MLMGKPAPGQDFAAEILALRERPQHVMFFNEPDMPTSVGGSSLSPARAAQIMKTEGRKLSAAGIKIVFAGTTSNQNGDQWRAQFKVECAGECPIDVMGFHFHGTDVAEYGRYVKKFVHENPGKEIWATRSDKLDMTRSQA